MPGSRSDMGEAAFGKTLTLPLITWTKIDEIRKALGLAGYAESITWCVSSAHEDLHSGKIHLGQNKRKAHKHGKK